MFITNQTFQETPDGLRLAFTTSRPFVLGSVTVFQGGLVASNFHYHSTQEIEFDTAPLPEDGVLLWSGVGIETPDAETTVGWWTLADWQAVYGNTPSLVASLALTEALAEMVNYLTTTAYDAAVALTEPYFSRCRRVQGELAAWYAARQSDGRRVVASSKTYADGIMSASQSYANTPSVVQQMPTTAPILAQLRAWQRGSAAFTPTVTWGTGRLHV